MKKNIIYIILLFATVNLFAQTNYKVTYDLVKNTAIPNTLKGYLLVKTDENKSFFKEDHTAKKQLKEQINGEKKLLIKPKSGIDKYLIISKDTIQELKLLGRTYVNVVDVNKGQDWKISNESKTIGNYKAIKASCNFRGRNWEAWFAPDISLSIGPWKFRGLPGLIIQVYDETKTFNYNLTKIETVNDDKITGEINDLLQRIEKKLSIKQFLAELEEYETNTLNTLLRGRGSYKREKGPRNGIELIYEWEEEPKK